MSKQEHLKADEATTSPKKIVNPLLSASVIGNLAFPTAGIPGLLPPEPKSLVTVGDSSSFDSENLDEINLNSPPEPTGPPAIIDTNANPLLDESIQNDSLLSQAASSFSALPAVASSVFSTFSKRIYAGNSREQSPFLDSTSHDNNANPNRLHQASFSQQQQQQQSIFSEQHDNNLLTPLSLGGPSSVEANINPLQNTPSEFTVSEPPKLYSPTELPSKAVFPPPSSGAQNSYRLTAKKKLYAPIPGLSGQSQPIQGVPINAEVIASDPSTSINYPQNYPAESASKQEERKGGLFSFTNLVPTGVLQNISGLVQTAAETLNPSTKPEDSSTLQPNPFYLPSQTSTNFFGPPPSTLPASSQIQQLPPKTTPDQQLSNHPQAPYFSQNTSSVPAPNLFINSGNQLPQLNPISTSETVLGNPLITPPSTFCEKPINIDENLTNSAKTINFFNPNEVTSQQSSQFPHFQPVLLTAPPTAQQNFQSSQIQTQHSQSAPPLTAPPPIGGNVSFRLQKGTRHYKSPLDSTESASLFASSQQQDIDIQAINPQSVNPPAIVPQAVFNPINPNYFETPLPTESENFKQNSSQSFILSNNSLEDTIIDKEKSETLIKPEFEPIAFPQTPTTLSTDVNVSKDFETKDISSTVIEQTTETILPQAQENTSIQTESKLPPSSIDINSDITSASENSNLPIFTTNTSSQLNILAPPTVLPPPAFSSSGQKTSNPYRKEPADSAQTVNSQPSLASFFTPLASNLTNDFGIVDNNSSVNIAQVTSNNAANFFSELSAETRKLIPKSPSQELSNVNSPTISTLVQSDISKETIKLPVVPALIGFEHFTADNKKTEEIKPSNESCSQLFGEVVLKKNENIPEVSEKQINFFDSFNIAQKNDILDTSVNVVSKIQLNDSTNSNEDQVIQNFFNNPPPKENSSEVGDLNYDLVHSGLGVRLQHTGSLTTVSNVVEPPSSACSEFSELNSDLSQRLLQAVGVSEAKSEPKLPKTNEVDIIKEKHNDLPEEILKELRMTSEKATSTSTTYTPAVKHWFYKRDVAQKYIWTPFSHYDSALLETSLTTEHAPNIVSVEGGRYDVNITERIKIPVYWEGVPIEVRRCSWFYKASDSKYVPYDEDTADRLEDEYRQAAESGVWHKKIIIARNEQVVFHGPTVIVHFQQQQNVDAWGGTSQTTSRPRVVKRDLDDFTIEQGESERVDHLLLMVHGIGAACDLKMRTVEEVVDDFRKIATALVQSHYKNSTDMDIVGRVEVLPISWHGHLHSEEMDEKLKSITLESIPKLRNFTNDTLLDVLFYTSPTFCQKIMNTVATAMNTLYMRYRERHPNFSGGVSLAGHSLGSLILFDLLCHQRPIKECEEQNLENPNQFYAFNQCPENSGMQPSANNISPQQISYTVGPAGTGQPYIQYAQLVFHPKKFFALGSPIGMFVTIRGIDKLGQDFRLPTCPGFYNIFHPFDPVAYRIEALVNPELSGIRPVLIPHHKGRKRMHLELKETMTRVGADLKQRFLDTFKNTFDSVNFISSARSKKDAEESMEKDVDQVIAMQMEMERQNETAEQNLGQTQSEVTATLSRSRANSNSTNQSDTDIVEIDLPLGKLNDSKRIDYVLQEAPLEFFNEYLFALSSHVCYWDSSDTILFVMKEIYSGMGISPDSQIPQQTMTIERPVSRNSNSILPPTI